MLKMKLAKGDLFVIDDKQYEFTRRYPDGRVEVEHLETGERQSFTDLELAETIAEGRATIWPGAMKKKKAIEVERYNFEALDEGVKNKARRAIKYLKRLYELGVGVFVREEVEERLKKIAKEVGDKKVPAYSTVCNWRKKAGEHLDIRNLVDQRHFKEGQPQLHPRVAEIIYQKVSEYYMSTMRPTIQSTHDQICAEIIDVNKTRDKNDCLPEPSYWAVREAIRRIDQYHVVAARHGKQAAEARFAPVGKGEIARWPGEVAELDHTKMDLIVVDEETSLPLGRPWLVVLIDRRTRMPLGFHVSFDPPSVQTVAECLKNAIKPKSYVKKLYPDIKGDWPCYGVPGWVVFDRAMENVGKDIEDMASSVGFNVTFCPRKKAWYKGIVERFLGTLNRKVTNRVPGKTFASILEREDYNPAKDSIVTYDELRHLIHKCLIDDYMQSPHRGLGGVPLKVWEREIKNHEIPPLPDLVQLEASLGRVETRVLSRKGIEFENLFYMREDVVAWLRDTKFCELTEKAKTGQGVKVKYDPTDMSKVWVLDPRTSRYVDVPCLDQGYTKSLSLWQHRVIKNYLRNQLQKDVNREGLLEARAEIEELVNEMLRGRRGKRKTSTAAKGARFEGVGRTAPSGDDVPEALSGSTNPHPPHPEGKSGSRLGGKRRQSPKTKSVDLPPAMSSDDTDVYVDEA